MVFKIILTLLISSAIGYATNYIAVKMLFRPLKPVYIGGKQLPFTPGIIPKGKPRLARALGEAVSKTLLTKEDIHNALVNDTTKKKVSEEICLAIYDENDKSLKESLVGFVGENDYSETRNGLKTILCEKITAGLKRADIGGIIASEGGAVLKEKFGGGMLSMFINDDLINSVAQPMGEKINEYIDTNGQQKLDEITEDELSEIEEKTLGQLMNDCGISREKFGKIIENIYENFLADKLGEMISSVDINKIVEEKVNAMEPSDLEKLVMSVMKKELGAVVNLGAVIGLVIGVLNVLVNIL